MALEYKANSSISDYIQPGSAALELSGTFSTKADANRARSTLSPLEKSSSLPELAMHIPIYLC